MPANIGCMRVMYYVAISARRNGESIIKKREGTGSQHPEKKKPRG
jgi:hypothetical protein